MLLNASVFQEIHSFFLHDHSDRQEIEHDNICNSSSHVHEIEHIALDCSVCDFHFSPSEKVVIFPSRLSVLPTTEMQYFYLENIAFRTGDPYPMLRAPPTQV